VRAGVGARVLGAVGDVLISAGAVVLLFCVYQLWWTNVAAAEARSSAISDLRSSWASPTAPDYGVPVPSASASADSSTLATPGASPSATPSTDPRPPKGTPFALIRIPRLGAGWQQPIVEGVDAAQLHEGIGHYVGTAMPGGRGNLALAGHRATNGEPFRNLDRMRPGDTVVVMTRDTTYTYVVDRPWFLVQPTAVQVIAPVPGKPGVHATERKMTLTTCNPRWASTQRLIVDLTLRSAVKRG
jgi:sortase A